MTKQEFRQRVRARMAALPKGYWQTAGYAICQQVLALPEYANARTVCCFVGTGAEICTTPLLSAALLGGKRLCVPACTGKGMMEMRQITALADLAPGAYGLPEPRKGAQVIEKSQIDLLLVPCLAGTKDGHRLGRGGGFYDRYLAGFHGTAALLCPEALLYPTVPTDGWDVPLPLVVSDDQTYRS